MSMRRFATRECIYDEPAAVVPAENAKGRWCGRWLELPCEVCGAVLAIRGERPEHPRCPGCRAESEVDAVGQLVRDLLEQLRAANARADRAELLAGQYEEIIGDLRAKCERGAA
jgi:hypothetical protein